MESLAAKMHVHLRRDECGDRTVIGKRGDLHRGTRGDASGYYVSIISTTPRTFHFQLKRMMDIAEITQEGDTEGVVFIPRAAALENARLIRSVIHARRIKEMSLEAKAAGALRLRDWRASKRSGAVQSAGLIFTGKQVSNPTKRWRSDE